MRNQSSAKFTELCGVPLNVDWSPESSVLVHDLPTSPGLYAEIHWEMSGVRIGETGRSIREKIRHDVRWFNDMHKGTAPLQQLKRTIPIALAAKAAGADAFSFYVVSADPRLADKSLRQECERYMFKWVETHKSYVSWNHQKSWR